MLVQNYWRVVWNCRNTTANPKSVSVVNQYSGRETLELRGVTWERPDGGAVLGFTGAVLC